MMSRHDRKGAILLLVVLPSLVAMTTACNKSTQKKPMQQAADMLCQAAKLGLDPPPEAYQAYAAKMNTTADKIKKHAPDAAGTEAFVAHIKKEVQKLPAKARIEFSQIFSASVAVDQRRKLEIFKQGFADSGITLTCKALERYLSRYAKPAAPAPAPAP